MECRKYDVRFTWLGDKMNNWGFGGYGRVPQGDAT